MANSIIFLVSQLLGNHVIICLVGYYWKTNSLLCCCLKHCNVSCCEAWHHYCIHWHHYCKMLNGSYGNSSRKSKDFVRTYHVLLWFNGTSTWFTFRVGAQTQGGMSETYDIVNSIMACLPFWGWYWSNVRSFVKYKHFPWSVSTYSVCFCFLQQGCSINHDEDTD